MPTPAAAALACATVLSQRMTVRAPRVSGVSQRDSMKLDSSSSMMSCPAKSSAERGSPRRLRYAGAA